MANTDAAAMLPSIGTARHTGGMDNEARPEADAPPKLKRRWLQYSTRALIGFITAVGVILGIALGWIAPAERQRASVHVVEQLGGVCHYADSPSGESWINSKCRNWLPRDYFDPVVAVNLRGSSASDDDLRLLAGLTELQELDLTITFVTDAGLVHLKEFKNLRILELGGGQFADTGLVHLAELHQLESLSLGGDEELMTITDAGLAHIGKLTQLRHLWLGISRVTDDGIATLEHLTELEALDLDGAQVTDAGIAHLDRFPHLQFLGLGDTRISDAGLIDLQRLTGLKELSLLGAEVTEPAVAELQKALPKCVIDY